MIVVYDRSFIVLANGVMIVNYDRKEFIVQATGQQRLQSGKHQGCFK
jgi:hypothetical protein